MSYLIVFLGAGLGGALRHALNGIVPRLTGSTFPYGTLLINVMGSFVMGILAGVFAWRAAAPQSWRLFLTTGVLGGFTTFSTFSLEAVLLYERGNVLAAVGYVSGSVALGLGGLFCGLLVVRSLT